MSTTLKEIGRFLYEADMRFKLREDENDAILSFETKHYINKENEKQLIIAISLDEEGDYIKIFAPYAFNITEDKAPVFLQACAMIQWRTKLIQFEYDENDGEIRPIIEFPLMDAALTKNQLMRCISGLLHIIEEYYTVLSNVLRTGMIDFSLEGQNSSVNDIKTLLEALPADLLEEILRKKRESDS